MRGKMRPPTAQWGSTKASWRLGTPTVIVSTFASVRPPAVVAVPAAVVVAPLAAVVVAPPAVVVAPPAVVVVDEPLLSPPQAANKAPSAAIPVVARNERRVANPNVPGSIGGIVSSWRYTAGASKSSIVRFPLLSRHPVVAGVRISRPTLKDAARQRDHETVVALPKRTRRQRSVGTLGGTPPAGLSTSRLIDSATASRCSSSN